MSRKRKITPNVVLRTFYIQNPDGSVKEIRVTGHPRNQSHLKDPNLPAEGTVVKLLEETNEQET